MYDVSFIIVSWNAKGYLEKCLRSIQPSGLYSAQIIVVDNASTDGSPEMVARSFPNVCLICNSENTGFARANNIGIQQAQGRYLCLINSDAEAVDNCIEKLIAFMDEHLDIGMAGPRILNADGSLQPSCRFFPTVWNNLCQAIWLHRLFPKSAFFSEPFMIYWPHDEQRDVDAMRGCFWFVRRQAFEQVGKLDELFYIYGEDIDWCKRFHLNGWRVVFYPEARAIHYGGASSANAPIRFCLEMQKADLQYWRKYYGRAGEMVYRGILLLRHGLRVILAGMVRCFWPSRKQTSYVFRRSWAIVKYTLGFTKIDTNMDSD